MNTVPAIATDPTNEKPPRRRRWIPLSLRMFVVILLLVGIGSLMWIRVPAYRQQVAIREVKRLGGTVHTSWGGPTWLSDCLHGQYLDVFDIVFDEVIILEFTPDEVTFRKRATDWVQTPLQNGGREFVSGPTVDDATLACIAAFPHLYELDLSWTNVGDAGMEHVCRLRDLEQLFLLGTDVSDASVDRLIGMRNLKVLCLDGRRVSEAGFVRIVTALPGCEVQRANLGALEN